MQPSTHNHTVMISFGKICFAIIFGSLFCVNVKQAIAAPTCSKELTEIMPQLLADLPSYSNRVIQRSRRLSRAEDTFSYVLTSGQADFRPLTLSTAQFTPTVADTTTQIFFTILEKQYQNNQSILSEQHHWLFLTPTTQGWAIAQLFSNIGNINPEKLAAPPRDSLETAIGQGIKLWLRDYNAHCPPTPDV